MRLSCGAIVPNIAGLRCPCECIIRIPIGMLQTRVAAFEASSGAGRAGVGCSPAIQPWSAACLARVEQQNVVPRRALEVSADLARFARRWSHRALVPECEPLPERVSAAPGSACVAPSPRPRHAAARRPSRWR
jgi:hypothetical protein